MRRDVFQAIADPTRRAIIQMISKQSLNLNAVADNFDISRPAISKHIKILTECGLIVIRQEGRERYCEAKLKKLNEVSKWVEQYEDFWNKKLDALENYLTVVQTKKRGMSNAKSLTADREIVITRLLSAPKTLVWDAWTQPEHLVHWYGPDGFSLTSKEMEVKSGGTWEFILHGPDGRDYPNKILFLEVEKPNRLVYKHSGDEDTEPVNFHVTVTFEQEGDKTKLTMYSVFESVAELVRVNKKYGAIEGAKQHVARLELYIKTIQ